MGAEVLDCARPIIAAAGATVTELRFAAARLAEWLTDALRISESRGRRLQRDDVMEQDAELGHVCRP